MTSQNIENLKFQISDFHIWNKFQKDCITRSLTPSHFMEVLSLTSIAHPFGSHLGLSSVIFTVGHLFGVFEVSDGTVEGSDPTSPVTVGSTFDVDNISWDACIEFGLEEEAILDTCAKIWEMKRLLKITHSWVLRENLRVLRVLLPLSPLYRGK